MSFEEAILAIGGMFGGLGIAALAIAGHFRHERRKRELEHLERMKAFELGRTLPQDEPWLSPMRLAAMIGAGVPLGAFASACVSTIALSCASIHTRDLAFSCSKLPSRACR